MFDQLIRQVSEYKLPLIGEREAQFLYQIGDGEDTSYKIYSRLKKVGSTMDYKNINKRVRRLHELGLIRDTVGESAHGAKFYALSSEGVFYYISHGWTIDKRWMKKYGGDIVIKYLIEPYFEEKTVTIDGIRYEFEQYLTQCCRMILSSVDAAKSISKHPRSELGKAKIYEQLKIDLEWQAKTLAYKLITKKTDFWYLTELTRAEPLLTSPELVEYFWWDKMEQAPHFEDLSHRYLELARDKKFMTFSNNIGVEYEDAFSRLIESAEKNDRGR